MEEHADTTLADVKAAAGRYKRTKSRFEHEAGELREAIVAALKAGHDPAEVVPLQPFTYVYVRKLAANAGLPPAHPGPKPTKRDAG